MSLLSLKTVERLQQDDKRLILLPVMPGFYNARAKVSWILTGLKVVVDNGRSDLIEVLEGVNNLHNDGAALFLWHELVLLQIEVQVIALAVLQDCAEAVLEQRGVV